MQSNKLIIDNLSRIKNKECKSYMERKQSNQNAIFLV